ncbi:MAG TPA: hypothetical protein VF092_24380 [Longimicrobium sp.]
MKKISLDVNVLKVESFDVSTVDAKAGGTVHARAFTRSWEQSCYVSCTNIADCICLSEIGGCDGTTPRQ